VARKGCHAVTFSEDPGALGWPNIFQGHWDPFFAACQDEGTVICLHIGSSSTMLGLKDGAPFDVLITMTPLNSMSAATDLLWSNVLRKFPDLQFALSEGSIGWLPYWLERIDYVYQQHRFWTHQDFGDQLPSQVARDH
ncbi:MAG: amidohydrolase, partial [Actinobacteria bacterium]